MSENNQNCSIHDDSFLFNHLAPKENTNFLDVKKPFLFL